jgi:hypothetical protein
MHSRPGFPIIEHRADLCVIGGGLAGLAAAVSAARKGLRVVLMQDRPVLGGNSSSEMRVHVRGADVHNQHAYLRETGLLEEWRLENLYRNPQRSYSVWDTILYESAILSNVQLLLNCSCMDAAMHGSHIQSVTGWQTTTQQYQRITADLFADCSGDGVLAPLTGAEFRIGREARGEYNESIAPECADSKTMGMTALFQSREYDSPQPFIPPEWAHVYENCEELPYGEDGHRWWEVGYWWLELGGEYDSIQDTERLRHELLKIVYGVWDHLKNRCRHKQEVANWALDWVQFLPGKRESRRYVGQQVLTQNDITAGGHFVDIIAYGGWPMDDHHPAGFKAVQLGQAATIFHPAPAPYGIPYGCLVSKNLDNLMFAGRDASCTHAAMSSTRVMGTCASMGQAVGTAAALAVNKGVAPWALCEEIQAVQQALLQDDCYLPGVPEVLPAMTLAASLSASRGDPQAVRDGWNRTIGADEHAWIGEAGDWIAYIFDTPSMVQSVRLTLDSALQREIVMSYHVNDDQLRTPPPELPKHFVVQGLLGDVWVDLQEIEDHHQRVFQAPIGRVVGGVRFLLKATWGGLPSRVFHFSVR